jgi:hypothetical protein
MLYALHLCNFLIMYKLHSPQTFCFHKLHPLVHLICGLTKCNILHFAPEYMAHSICLMVAIKYLINYGFVWFLMIHQSV